MEVVKKKSLSVKEIKEIIDNYDIGEYESSEKNEHAVENAVYHLKTNRGKFIIKLYTWSKKALIQWTVDINENLRLNGLPIPKTFKTKKDDFVLPYQKQFITIQEFVEGTEIKKFDEEFILEYARTIAKLDQILLTIPLTGKHKWGKIGYQFSKSFYRSTSKILEFNFDEEEKKLLKELRKNIDKTKLRPSIIHSDFQLKNLIVENDKIKAIIDWGDMHEDYISFEVTVAIDHLFFTLREIPNIRKNLPIFFKEYEKYVPLNEEEKKSIYYFLKNRMLASMVWCDTYRKEHKDKAEKLTRWLEECIQSYRIFDKITLSEFLDIIKY